VQSASAQLSASTPEPMVTVTEPVIVYVTRGSETPFSTSTIHPTVTSIIDPSVSSAVSIANSSLEPESTTTSFVTVHAVSTTVVRFTVYPTTSPAFPSALLSSSVETAASENTPVETIHVTSTKVVPMTVYQTIPLPLSASSPLPSSNEIAPSENAPVATVHVTSTRIVLQTVHPTTSASASDNAVPSVTAQAARAPDPTSVMDANVAGPTSAQGHGIDVHPVTPAGFVTITETETKTVTDRVTETVTATVTRD
jgi:hypothetical protein